MAEKEYIEREAAIKAVCTGCSPQICSLDCDIATAVKAIPAADVRPVVRGRWTLNKDGSGTCSECGFVQNSCWDLDNWDNFCHHCGADMRDTNDEKA